MGVEGFERYYQEYCVLISQAAEDASIWKELDDILDLMMVEARNEDDYSLKQELIARSKQYKMNVKALREQQQRDTLLSDAAATASSNKLQPNLQDATMERQNDTLERARQTIQETEEIGVEISFELARNRETIQSAHRKVHELKSDTNQADKILNRMNRWWNR